MNRYMYIYSKYRFRGLPLLVLSDNNKFYRLPFNKNKKYYDIKELKVHYHQGQNKLLYNGKRYTKKKLNELKYKHKELIKTDINKFYLP